VSQSLTATKASGGAAQAACRRRRLL